MNLINAIIAQPMAPCDKHKCQRRQDCLTKELACQSFLTYVDLGKVSEPTEPNADIYRLTFSEDAKQESLF